MCNFYRLTIYWFPLKILLWNMEGFQQCNIKTQGRFQSFNRVRIIVNWGFFICSLKNKILSNLRWWYAYLAKNKWRIVLTSSLSRRPWNLHRRWNAFTSYERGSGRFIASKQSNLQFLKPKFPMQGAKMNLTVLVLAFLDIQKFFWSCSKKSYSKLWKCS